VDVTTGDGDIVLHDKRTDAIIALSPKDLLNIFRLRYRAMLVKVHDSLTIPGGEYERKYGRQHKPLAEQIEEVLQQGL
jgi:hypothetical protein